MGQVSNVFFTDDNFFNVTRNFSFIGIIALGMTAVIITRGIDLSVGSIVGSVGHRDRRWCSMPAIPGGRGCCRVC